MGLGGRRLVSKGLEHKIHENTSKASRKSVSFKLSVDEEKRKLIDQFESMRDKIEVACRPALLISGIRYSRHRKTLKEWTRGESELGSDAAREVREKGQDGSTPIRKRRPLLDMIVWMIVILCTARLGERWRDAEHWESSYREKPQKMIQKMCLEKV